MSIVDVHSDAPVSVKVYQSVDMNVLPSQQSNFK